MTGVWIEYYLELTEGKSYPVLSGVDVGHTDPMLTVPLAERAEINSEEGVWAMEEGGV